MINLLPLEDKEKLLSERKKRITIILWLLFLFFLFCLALVLFSISIYLQSQTEYQKKVLIGGEKEFEQSEIQKLREKINSINSIVTKLIPFYLQKFYFSKILEKISEVLPQEAYLTNLSTTFSVSKEEKPKVKISLSGFIPTRESLLKFKKNLEEKSSFEKIYFPPSNWVKPTDINFFASFEISH